ALRRRRRGPALCPSTTLFRSRALERRRHADGTIHLSLEVAYGHAWRVAARRGVFGDLPVTTFKRARPLEPGKQPPRVVPRKPDRSEEHTSELQSREKLVCRLL